MAVIALLTDFGTRDHYVGTMKGVILGIEPGVSLVDVSHEVAPQDVLGGALQLAACHRYFPPDTIFLAVVDPGVGSSRRAIAAEAGGYRFVAPDNGILSLVFRDVAPSRVVELRERRYALPEISATFEGRDRFAPAAAWLATGVDLGLFGPAVHDYQQLDVPVPSVEAPGVRGVVLTVDRFGNLVTNIPRALVHELGGAKFRVGGTTVTTLAATYAQLPGNAVGALFGSSNHLEFAVNGGSAAGRLGLGRGAVVEVHPLDKARGGRVLK
jgi:hypothetical protein